LPRKSIQCPTLTVAFFDSFKSDTITDTLLLVFSAAAAVAAAAGDAESRVL
jgi:hypothetical protein